MPAWTRRLSSPVRVVADDPPPKPVPSYAVALLGAGTGAALTAAIGRWSNPLDAVVLLIMAFTFGGLLVASCFRMRRVVDGRRSMRQRAAAHARRVAGLLESARGLTAQNSEPAVYEQLKLHAESLVPHDHFELAIFDEHGALAGRYSEAGLIDGLNALPTPSELAVVRGHTALLGAGDTSAPFDLATGNADVAFAQVREAYLPVFNGRVLLAVVTVRRERGGYTGEELDALAALCQQAGIAIGRARLFMQVLSAKREWERVFDSTAEGLALVDVEGRVRRCNAAFAAFGGLSFATVIGQDHHALGAISFGRGDDCAICRTIRGGTRAERIVEASDGRTIKLTVSPYSTGGAVLVAQDVTAETQVRNAEQQLFESEKFAAIGRLAAGVSHEVNNPLMGINGLATVLLEDEAFTGENREMVALIQRESRRAAQITRDLLSFVRAEDGARVAVDLNEIATEVAAIRAVPQQSAGVTMTLDLAAELPKVWASRAQLVQVIVNLVANAEDAMESSPRREIRVSTLALGEMVVLRVEDSGPGIPEELRARLFEPFFTTKAPGKGTGLGLSLSFSICERHGGSLRADSATGGGARFTIELPAQR